MALSDGYRESKASWLAVIQDLRERGLKDAPQLAVGDGAPGFWAALDEAWARTRCQRCWAHKTANVPNEMPKSIQGKAKAGLHGIWMAETQVEAEKAFGRSVKGYGAKCPKAVECLKKGRAVPLAFYGFPAEHWTRIRTGNPIESTFATVRHRTTRAKNCVSRNTLLGLVFQLALTAQRGWRRLDGFKRLPDVVKGARFQGGIAVVESPDETAEEQQRIAA